MRAAIPRGFYALSSAGKRLGLGLAAEPRLGFHGGDSGRLAGMSTRRLSLEAGLAFDWENPLFSTDLSRIKAGIADYYFGVRPFEATAQHASYSPGAGSTARGARMPNTGWMRATRSSSASAACG